MLPQPSQAQCHTLNDSMCWAGTGLATILDHGYIMQDEFANAFSNAGISASNAFSGISNDT
eukprot:5348149-Alexandrium_andersonii.AAC.1